MESAFIYRVTMPGLPQTDSFVLFPVVRIFTGLNSSPPAIRALIRPADFIHYRDKPGQKRRLLLPSCHSYYPACLTVFMTTLLVNNPLVPPQPSLLSRFPWRQLRLPGLLAGPPGPWKYKHHFILTVSCFT